MTRDLEARPAAIVLGPAFATVLSGTPIALKDLIVSGLRFAEKNSILKRDQFSRLLPALESLSFLENLKIGSLLEPLLRSKKGLLADWLRETLGRARIVNPTPAGPVLKAAQDGFLIASTTYEVLLEEVTGLASLTWLDFRSPSQLFSPHAVLRLHGSRNQPESIVRALPGASGNELHRRAIDTFLADLRFLLVVGAVFPVQDGRLGEALQRRGESLPGVILCPEAEVELAKASVQEHLPWFRIAPFPGGNDALPEVLKTLFGSAPLPGIPALGSTHPSQRALPESGYGSDSGASLQPAAVPESVSELGKDPRRLALFLARLALRHREGLPLLETLEPSRLVDALRPTNVLASTTPSEFADRLQDLERDLDASFEPPPIWIAWMDHVRGTEVARLGEELVALAGRANPHVARPSASASASEAGESPETASTHFTPKGRPQKPARRPAHKEIVVMSDESAGANVEESPSPKAPRRKARPNPPPETEL